MSYVLAAIGQEPVRSGAGLGVDPKLWDVAEKVLPSTSDQDDGSSSLAVEYRIPAG